MNTIWVVEDDDIVAQLAAELLRIQGYEIVLFSGGQAAIDQLESGERPDLLLLDLSMTPPDGNDVLDTVNRLENRPPVVLLTACPEYLRPDLETSHAGIICKPFTLRGLMDIVQSTLSQRH